MPPRGRLGHGVPQTAPFCGPAVRNAHAGRAFVIAVRTPDIADLQESHCTRVVDGSRRRVRPPLPANPEARRVRRVRAWTWKVLINPCGRCSQITHIPRSDGLV